MPPLPRKLLLLALLLVFASCGFKISPNQLARDAALIVSAVTPVAQGVGTYGASPETTAQVARMLADTTADSAILSNEGVPGLLEEQNFLLAAQSLLLTLGTVSGMPPDAAGVVQAATALLPPFADAVNSPIKVSPRMSPDQARLILEGPGVVARPLLTAPPPAAPAVAAATTAPAPALPALNAPRFRMSVDDVDGRLNYEFLDHGQVIEKGSVATFRILESRYDAFKKLRLSQSP